VQYVEELADIVEMHPGRLVSGQQDGQCWRPFDARAKTVLATGLIALSRRGAREDPLRWSRNAAFLGRR
jgi:hypothetical protein